MRVFTMILAAALIACGGPADDLEGAWGTAGKTVMTFEDGKLVLPNGESLPYTVKSVDGKRVTLEVEQKSGKKRERVVEIEGDRLVLDPDGDKFELQRIE